MTGLKYEHRIYLGIMATLNAVPRKRKAMLRLLPGVDDRRKRYQRWEEEGERLLSEAIRGRVPALFDTPSVGAPAVPPQASVDRQDQTPSTPRSLRLPDSSTLAYLARALRSDVESKDTLAIVMPLLERLYRSYSDHAPVQRSTATPSGPALPSQSQSSVPAYPQLQGLPIELLIELRDWLADPTDVAALAQSCRMLRAALDLLLPDVAKFAQSWVREKRALGRRLRGVVFEVRDRLRRDRMRVLAGNVREGERVCRVCVKVHPVGRFPHVQRGQERDCCIASLLRLPVCEHRAETFISLRRIREALLTSPTGETIKCHSDNRACRSENVRKAAFHVDSLDHLILTKEIPIIRPMHPRDLTLSNVAYELDKANLAGQVCPHLRPVGAVAMVVPTRRGRGEDALAEAIVARFDGLGSGRAKCSMCATSWSLRVPPRPSRYAAGDEAVAGGTASGTGDSGYAPGREREVRLTLVVRQVLGDLEDPWASGYLSLAGDEEVVGRLEELEGGMRGMEERGDGKD